MDTKKNVKLQIKKMKEGKKGNGEREGRTEKEGENKQISKQIKM